MSHPYGNGRGPSSGSSAPDTGFRAATIEDGARERDLYPPYLASGRKLGHGTAAWLPAPPEEMPVPGPRRPDSAFTSPRPVVALLDTGVQDHDVLLLDSGEPYWTEAPGWVPPLPIPSAEPGVYGSHWGHATFLAGLIRLAAPDARLLSLRVMDDSGRASDTNVAAALTWLADQSDGGMRLDVVLAAFGRTAETSDEDLAPVRAALARLARLGVTVVASAGNSGSEQPVYPAAFAADAELSVISVGARVSPTERARFSNHGVWVRGWGAGTNVVSIMPLRTTVADGGGFAYWSGTSFPAASHAGVLAQAVADRSARAAT